MFRAPVLQVTVDIELLLIVCLLADMEDIGGHSPFSDETMCVRQGGCSCPVCASFSPAKDQLPNNDLAHDITRAVVCDRCPGVVECVNAIDDQPDTCCSIARHMSSRSRRLPTVTARNNRLLNIVMKSTPPSCPARMPMMEMSAPTAEAFIDWGRVAGPPTSTTRSTPRPLVSSRTASPHSGVALALMTSCAPSLRSISASHRWRSSKSLWRQGPRPTALRTVTHRRCLE